MTLNCLRFLLALVVLQLNFLIAFAEERSEQLQGEEAEASEVRMPIEDVIFKNLSLNEETKARILGFRDREYHPGIARQIIRILTDSGSDSWLEIKAEKKDHAFVLIVESKAIPKIRGIVFRGNHEFADSKLKEAIDYKDGMDLDRKAISLLQQKIQSFYNSESFLGSEIKFDFENGDQTAVFQITEGEPVQIGSVQLSPLSILENRTLRYRYERDLRVLFGLQPGQRIVKQKVLEGTQRVKDWLRDHDFLMAKDPILETKLNEAGKIDLFLRIDYGYRIRFGFRGNTQFSYRELISFVREIKEVSAGTDYLESVKRKILESYKEIGLANAQITTLVHEDSLKGIRYISLVVNEGKKIRIRDLSIKGITALKSEEARSKFDQLATRLVQRGFFHESGINKAGDLLAEYLVSMGYLSAKLEFTKFEFNQDRSEVTVSLLFNEGVQTIVESVNITGLKSISAQEVRSVLDLEQGKPFNIFSFERGLLAIKDQFQELGNLSMQIVNEGSDNSIVKYSRDQSTVSILLEIDEGPLFKVGEVIVRGNTQTHSRVVTRELPFIRGDTLTKSLLNKAEDNLRKLNLFSSIVVRTLDSPSEDGEKDILILLEEAEPGSLEVAPGYRTDLGLRLGLGSTYSNLGGWNRSFSAQIAANRRTENYHFPELSLSLGFREPYLAGLPLVFTSNLYVYKRQYNSFDADVVRVTSAIKKSFNDWLAGFLEYSYERVHISNAHGKYSVSDERTNFIGSFTPGIIVDTRNDLFNPTRGFHSVNRFEMASSIFGSEKAVGFYRTTTINTAYLKLFDDLVLALGANFGYERSNISGHEIPIFKLFRIGGVGSVRGYTEDSIELETQKIVYGSLAMQNYRAELRIPFSQNLGTAAFVDAGNLYLDRVVFNPSFFRSSVGTGLRYKTPVGPVVLDFGWKLQKTDQVGDTVVPAGDRFKIHFAIGSF